MARIPIVSGWGTVRQTVNHLKVFYPDASDWELVEEIRKQTDTEWGYTAETIEKKLSWSALLSDSPPIN